MAVWPMNAQGMKNKFYDTLDRSLKILLEEKFVLPETTISELLDIVESELREGL